MLEEEWDILSYGDVNDDDDLSLYQKSDRHGVSWTNFTITNAGSSSTSISTNNENLYTVYELSWVLLEYKSKLP